MQMERRDALVWSNQDFLFIFQQTVEALIAFSSLFGNALVLFVIYQYKMLQTTPNYLIASQAMADLLVGIVGIPCVIINNFMIPYNLLGCLVMSSIVIALTQVSIFGLVAIAFERLIAIRYPFQHREKFTKTLIAFIICLCWVLGFLVGFVPVFGWHNKPVTDYCIFNLLIDMNYMIYFNFFGFVLTPLLCILIIYIDIFKAIKKRNTKIRTAVTASVRQQRVNMTTCTNETSVALHIFLIIIVSYTTMLPLHLINMVYLYAGYLNRTVTIIAVLLSHLNSALNPILYARGNHKFRQAMKRTLQLKFGETTVTEQRTANEFHR